MKTKTYRLHTIEPRWGYAVDGRHIDFNKRVREYTTNTVYIRGKEPYARAYIQLIDNNPVTQFRVESCQELSRRKSAQVRREVYEVNKRGLIAKLKQAERLLRTLE